jgi:hypothetical protein
MSAAVALVNIVLGLAYCGYGVMTAIEMKRDWKSFGFTHFGTAWLFMAFTCGPHHLVHGVHIALEGRLGGPLDLFSVIVGLPVGVIWLALRVEAFAGGRGDRFIPGTPAWLLATPALAFVYVVALFAAAYGVGGGFEMSALSTANVLLVFIYMAIGWFLLRTQLRNREPMGGWSLSGLSLSAVFPTCALMHGIWALYNIKGVYQFDVHGLIVDFLSIPAAIYFLWVVRGLYRESLRDWNRVTEEGELPAVALLRAS